MNFSQTCSCWTLKYFIIRQGKAWWEKQEIIGFNKIQHKMNLCHSQKNHLMKGVGVEIDPTRGSEQSGCWKLPRVGWDFSDFWGFTWVFFTFETHSTPTRSVGFSAISLEKWDFLPKTTFFLDFTCYFTHSDWIEVFTEFQTTQWIQHSSFYHHSGINNCESDD